MSEINRYDPHHETEWWIRADADGVQIGMTNEYNDTYIHHFNPAELRKFLDDNFPEDLHRGRPSEDD